MNCLKALGKHVQCDVNYLKDKKHETDIMNGLKKCQRDIFLGEDTGLGGDEVFYTEQKICLLLR